MRKNITYFLHGTRNQINLLKGFLLKRLLKWQGCKVGKGNKVWKIPQLIGKVTSSSSFGHNLTIGRLIAFDFTLGKIIIGDYCELSHKSLICGPIKVGNFVLIAENTEVGKVLKSPLQETTVGEDVWIAAGASIENGVNVPNGCIIAAKCSITRETALVENGIFVGNPGKFVKLRSK